MPRAPRARGQSPRWNGGTRWLSYDLCQAMRRVLIRDEVPDSWSERARRDMQTQRAEHEFLCASESPMIEAQDEVTWWNYAGGAANLLLAQLLEKELGEKIVARNVSLTFRGEAGKSASAIRAVLSMLREQQRPTEEDAVRFAEGAKRGRLSKFEACLPDGMLQRFFADTVVDLEGARRAVNAPANDRQQQG